MEESPYTLPGADFRLRRSVVSHNRHGMLATPTRIRNVGVPRFLLAEYDAIPFENIAVSLRDRLSDARLPEGIAKNARWFRWRVRTSDSYAMGTPRVADILNYTIRG